MAPLARTRLSTRGRPTASATAMPCASMPTEPSVTIHVFSDRALRFAAMSASALLGRCSGLAAMAVTLSFPKLPERKALNFFSILLV